MSKSDRLTRPEIKRVLNTCLVLQSSQCRRAAIVLSHAGMRVTEIGLLQTKSVITQSGMIRSEIALPAKICKNLKHRSAWLSNPKTRDILQEWIDYRLKMRWGTGDHGEYMGLNPESRFLYSNRGRPYSLQPKYATLKSGEVREYQSCDALQAMITDTYKKCGLFNASSHAGRKSLATNAALKGVDIEDIAQILGHDSPQTTLEYIVIDERRIREMYAAIDI